MACSRGEETGTAYRGSTACQSLLPGPAWPPVHPASACGFPVRTTLPWVEDPDGEGASGAQPPETVLLVSVTAAGGPCPLSE